MTEREPYPSEKQDRFIVRLPDGMRDRIKAAADANNRSMNAEIVATLAARTAPEMTLRDWFAGNMPIQSYNINDISDAAAFVGISPPDADDFEAMFELAAKVEAKVRYIYADAMLAARKGGDA
jgi:hypothetical protein